MSSQTIAGNPLTSETSYISMVRKRQPTGYFY